MAKERIMTLSELAEFCAKNKIGTFSASDSGKPIACTFTASATFEDSNDNDPLQTDSGIYYTKVRVCHTGENLNKSSIADDVMTNALPSLANRPVLAYIHQLDDDSWDFWSHNMNIITDQDGNQQVEYLEQQVGNITSDTPTLEYDKDMDKTYVVAKMAIPEQYTKAADILRSKNGTTDVSCEILIDNMSFDAESKVLVIKSFIFTGLTLLGSDDEGNKILPGMEGSHTVNDEQNNETFSKSSGKEVNTMFDELLKKYNVTVDQLDFEVDGLSDEELQKKFAEKFDQQSEEEPSDHSEEPIPQTNEKHEDVPEQKSADDTKSDDIEKITYELSHDDIHYMLRHALGHKYEMVEFDPMIVDVFDDTVVYRNWYDQGKHFYRLGYTKNDTDVTLADGDATEVFPRYLTADEVASIDSQKQEFEKLKQFKADADKKELDAKKDEIFNAAAYSVLADNEDFKSLKEHRDEYSVEEIQNKADLIFAAYVKATGSFSLNNKNVDDAQSKTPNVQHVNFQSESKKEPYTGLFAD